MNHKGLIGQSPKQMAQQSAAKEFLVVMNSVSSNSKSSFKSISGLIVTNADGPTVKSGSSKGVGGGRSGSHAATAVNGFYAARPASEVPREFATVCRQN